MILQAFARMLPILLAAFLAASAARAQVFTLLYSFPAETGSPYSGLTEGPDGRLYGMTSAGGLWGQGSIFVLDPLAGGGFAIETIYSFTGGYDGAYPNATMILASDGYFYGSTFTGTAGISPGGTIFRADSSGNLTTLHVFFGFNGDGYNPNGKLLEASDGNLYGVTQQGGIGYGTAFRIDPEGNLTTLHHFEAGDEGAQPKGPLVEGPGGLLYGTTPFGGPFGGEGTIFRISFGGVFETIHNFEGPEGQYPTAGLVFGPDGNLWGTAGGGGLGFGTVFRSDLAGTVVTGFPFTDPNLGSPSAELLVGTDDNLYGTTFASVFRATTDGTLTTLHFFGVGPEGYNLQGSLVQAPDGALYGTTLQAAAPHVYGTVFRMATDGDEFESLGGFGSAHARNPIGPLLQGTDGRLYGTAGGSFDLGTIFRINPGGEVTTLHLFLGPDGKFPSGLVRTADGQMFGSAYSGGVEDRGVVFEVDAAGTLVPLHEFVESEGAAPQGLTLARDGSLWGTLGGSPQVFRLGPSGEFIPVHAIEDSAIGELTETEDGIFVGATYGGGAASLGTIFQVDGAAEYSVLHTFYGWDGSHPSAAPILGPDGNLYGMTAAGGPLDFGTIYRMSPGGRLRTIHHFAAADGLSPVGRLVVGGDGNLYGVTRFGGDHALGNVFRVNGSGTVTSLHSFSGDDGRGPLSQLLQGIDGGLYGATELGGLFGGGTVFRLEPAPSASVWTLTPTSGPASGGTTVTVTGSGFLFPEPTFGSQPATDVALIDQDSFTAVTPALGPGALYPIHVTNLNGREGELGDAWFADFLDVPQGDIFHAAVESVFREGITAGCGGGLYCRDAAITREQMAIFLLRGKHGSGYVPPQCAGGIFVDVPCPGPFSDWIEQLFHEAITGGCATGYYCPSAPVSRSQMAVFLLKAEHGSTHVPPACAGIFEDVPCPGAFTDWIEELFAEGVTGGCSVIPLLYCPSSSSTRGQIAVFLVRTFQLP